MRKAILLFIGIAALGIAGFIAFQTLSPKQSSEKVGPDSVFLGSSALSFSEALPQLNKMLDQSATEKMEALSALESKPHLVKNSPLYGKILDLGLKSENYSNYDKALETLLASGGDYIADKDLLALGERAEVRRIALLIAVANGSPEAINVINKLKDSQSPTEQHIASSAQRWLDLYGTQDAPQPPPLIYRAKLVPFSTFLENVSSDLATGNPQREQVAIDCVERSFATKEIPSDSRDKLIAVLAEFADANITNDAAKSNLQSISRAAFFAGGPASKLLLVKLSQSPVSSVSEGANISLGDFDEFHSENK